MRLRPGVWIHALAAIALACSTPAAIAQPPGGANAPPHETITGTVWRVDARAGTFDLLTAVGHSVRVRHIRYPADLMVKSGASAAGMAALGSGTVCRVECDVTASGLTATAARVVLRADGRTP